MILQQVLRYVTTLPQLQSKLRQIHWIFHDYITGFLFVDDNFWSYFAHMKCQKLCSFTYITIDT